MFVLVPGIGEADVVCAALDVRTRRVGRMVVGAANRIVAETPEVDAVGRSVLELLAHDVGAVAVNLHRRIIDLSAEEGHAVVPLLRAEVVRGGPRDDAVVAVVELLLPRLAPVRVPCMLVGDAGSSRDPWVDEPAQSDPRPSQNP